MRNVSGVYSSFAFVFPIDIFSYKTETFHVNMGAQTKSDLTAEKSYSNSSHFFFLCVCMSCACVWLLVRVGVLCMCVVVCVFLVGVHMCLHIYCARR